MTTADSSTISSSSSGKNFRRKNMTDKLKKTGLELLREPFPPHQINKLPKPTPAQTDAVKKDYKQGFRCEECGQWHARGVVHLDYVGHAALTDRLLQADPAWNWEPLAVGPDGYPVIDKNGGMWIRLTVCGVTRLGYGDAQGKAGGNAIKECIGDALRNAAMRFGAALDLWHKGELHVDEEGGDPDPESKHKDDGFSLDASIKWIKGAKTPLESINRARNAYAKADTDEERLTIQEIGNSYKETA